MEEKDKTDTGSEKLGTSGQLVTDLKDAKLPSDAKSSDYEHQSLHDAIVSDMDKRLANPLKALSQEEVVQRGRDFAVRAGVPDKADLFAKAALLARDPLLYETLPLLDDEDRAALQREEQKRWDQPWTMYLLVVCCSLGAVVQGELDPSRRATPCGLPRAHFNCCLADVHHYHDAGDRNGSIGHQWCEPFLPDDIWY